MANAQFFKRLQKGFQEEHHDEIYDEDENGNPIIKEKTEIPERKENKGKLERLRSTNNHTEDNYDEEVEDFNKNKKTAAHFASLLDSDALEDLEDGKEYAKEEENKTFSLDEEFNLDNLPTFESLKEVKQEIIESHESHVQEKEEVEDSTNEENDYSEEYEEDEDTEEVEEVEEQPVKRRRGRPKVVVEEIEDEVEENEEETISQEVRDISETASRNHQDMDCIVGNDSTKFTQHSSEISIEVLNFSIKHIMNFLLENYESSMFTKDYCISLFKGYIGGSIDSTNPLFKSLVEEVIENKIEEPVFGSLTRSILEYVKEGD